MAASLVDRIIAWFFGSAIDALEPKPAERLIDRRGAPM